VAPFESHLQLRFGTCQRLVFVQAQPADAPELPRRSEPVEFLHRERENTMRQMTGLNELRERGRMTWMDVVAFCSPGYPDWRWRIVDYAGQTVADSSGAFRTVGAAVAAAREHLDQLLDLADRSVPTARDGGTARPPAVSW
jgi:hypothetical protein